MLTLQAIRLVKKVQVLPVMGRIRRKRIVRVGFDDMPQSIALKGVQIDVKPIAVQLSLQLGAQFKGCPEDLAAIGIVIDHPGTGINLVRVIHLKHVRQIAGTRSPLWRANSRFP